MAVRRIDVTTVPTAVANVDAGTTYALQNQSNEPVYVDTASVAPADRLAPGIELPRKKYRPETPNLHYVSVETGESLYLWTREGTAQVVIVEAIG